MAHSGPDDDVLDTSWENECADFMAAHGGTASIVQQPRITQQVQPQVVTSMQAPVGQQSMPQYLPRPRLALLPTPRPVAEVRPRPALLPLPPVPPRPRLTLLATPPISPTEPPPAVSPGMEARLVVSIVRPPPQPVVVMRPSTPVRFVSLLPPANPDNIPQAARVFAAVLHICRPVFGNVFEIECADPVATQRELVERTHAYLQGNRLTHNFQLSRAIHNSVQRVFHTAAHLTHNRAGGSFSLRDIIEADTYSFHG